MRQNGNARVRRINELKKICRVRELVSAAYIHGEASASGGRWTARKVRQNGKIIVTHFETDMILVDPVTKSAVMLSEGWRSQTDRRGVDDILRYEGIPETYTSLNLKFGRDQQPKATTPAKGKMKCAMPGCLKPRELASSRCIHHSWEPKAELIAGLKQDGCTFTELTGWVDDFPTLVHDGDTCPVHEMPELPARWVPPISVEDTVGIG